MRNWERRRWKPSRKIGVVPSCYGYLTLRVSTPSTTNNDTQFSLRVPDSEFYCNSCSTLNHPIANKRRQQAVLTCCIQSRYSTKEPRRSSHAPSYQSPKLLNKKVDEIQPALSLAISPQSDRKSVRKVYLRSQPNAIGLRLWQHSLFGVRCPGIISSAALQLVWLLWSLFLLEPASRPVHRRTAESYYAQPAEVDPNHMSVGMFPHRTLMRTISIPQSLPCTRQGSCRQGLGVSVNWENVGEK